MIAFNGLTQAISKDKCEQRRCSRLSFQQMPKDWPRARTKTPVIQGELQLALSVQRSIMPT